MRRTDSATAALASCEVSRRPCRRSNDEMVCRLFFTRWWISRIVASLVSSRRSRLRTSVTSRSSSTPPVTVACPAAPDRIGMHRVSRVTSSVWSNSSITGAMRVERPAHRGVVEPELGEAQPDGVGADADAVQRRHGVRRGVAHPGVLVEHHHAVADARRGAGVADRAAVGERALGDHRREPLEDADVGALQLAGQTAGAARPLAGQHGDRAGRRSAPGWPSSAPARPATTRRCRPRRSRPARYAAFSSGRSSSATGADVVGDVDRLAGGRAHLADDEPRALRPSARTAAGRRSTGRRADRTR